MRSLLLHKIMFFCDIHIILTNFFLSGVKDELFVKEKVKLKAAKTLKI